MAEYIIRESKREKEGCAQKSIDETKNRIWKQPVITSKQKFGNKLTQMNTIQV